MTTTLVINGQSIGTSTNKGNGVFSINQVSFQSTSTAFVVSVKLVNGASPVDPSQRVRVWYTSTSWTVSATNAPLQIGKTARYVELTPVAQANGTSICDSSLEPITGASFNLWVDAPSFVAAGSLSINLVELP